MDQIQYVCIQLISIIMSTLKMYTIRNTIIPNLDMTGQYMYNSHSLPVFQIACLYALANFFQSFTVITLYSLIKC